MFIHFTYNTKYWLSNICTTMENIIQQLPVEYLLLIIIVYYQNSETLKDTLITNPFVNGNHLI